ncbi:hypothetical protein QCA50_005297 [Cerrena zonata]|uniref:GST C-terminal domain-containing protein n=1 Tax=Cerrena zonata TaxID=2478898 RepID=A0AAW0GJ66_9APHY
MAFLPSVWPRVSYSSSYGGYTLLTCWDSSSSRTIILRKSNPHGTVIARVWGVLESILSKPKWLVGGKVTIADLSFIPWNKIVISGALQGEDVNISQFLAVAVWRQRLLALDAVKKAYAERTRALQG